MPGLGFWYRKAVQADFLGFNLRFQACRASHSLHLPVHKHGGLRNMFDASSRLGPMLVIFFDIKNMNAAPQPYAWCFKVLKIYIFIYLLKKNMLMNFNASFWGFKSSKKTMCPITFPYHAFIISPFFIHVLFQRARCECLRSCENVQKSGARRWRWENPIVIIYYSWGKSSEPWQKCEKTDGNNM
jgi:hypothetical protein